MQSFISDYNCDLFVSASIAHSGQSTNGENIAGWVADLCSGLQSLLAQKLGKRDWGVIAAPSIGNQPQTNEIINQSAALVVVLTRDYVQDDKCLLELDSFLASHDASNRIAVVLADDVDRASWPAVLRNLLPFEFLTKVQVGSNTQGGQRRRLHISDKLFPVLLDDLSTELAIRLVGLKQLSEGTPPQIAPGIFLGTASPDVVDVRDSMRRYLMQEGFRIVPDRWRSSEPAAFRQATLNGMRDSHLFVQLLGQVSLPIASQSAHSFGQIEIEVAKEAGISVMSWRDPRLDLNKIADLDHRRLIEGEYVLAVSIEEFKRKVVERAHTHATKPATVSDKPLVVVSASKVDRQLARQVGELLNGKGLSIEIPDTEEFPWEHYSNGTHSVGGLVIVYGACPAIWVRQQLWKYRKAMARIESRPPLCAVCEGPPQTKEPLRYDVPQMDTIDCKVQLTEAALSSFIDAVRRRCSQ